MLRWLGAMPSALVLLLLLAQMSLVWVDAARSQVRLRFRTKASITALASESSSSESGAGKESAPSMTEGPHPPPNTRSLLQPLQFSTTSAPLGSPEKALSLIKEMNQQWEGMEDPNAANNPWDSLTSHGNQAAAFSGPSTKVGTQGDPYNKMFGEWRQPPRAVPPPAMYSTFIFDPNHPFRRRHQSKDPSDPVASGFWHPMQNQTFYDITKFPRVVLPIPRPIVKRSKGFDKYGAPGRRPGDWLYERIPARARIVQPQRLPRFSKENQISYEYPHFSILNPRSAFQRHLPTAQIVNPAANLMHFSTRPRSPSFAKPADTHFGPALIEVAPVVKADVRPHRRASPQPSMLETGSAMQHHASARAHTHARAETQARVRSGQRSRGRVRDKAAIVAQRIRSALMRSPSLFMGPTRAQLRVPSALSRESTRPALLQVDSNAQRRLTSALRSVAHLSSATATAAAVASTKVEAKARSRSRRIESKKRGGRTVKSSHGSRSHSSAKKKQLPQRTVLASDSAKAHQPLFSAAFESVDDSDVVSHPAAQLHRPPTLLQYEIALRPHSEQRTADSAAAAAPSLPSPSPSPLPSVLASPPSASSDALVFAETAAATRATAAAASTSRVSNQARTETKSQTQAETELEVVSEEQVDDAALDLAAQHRALLAARRQRDEANREAAWERSPDSKMPWWERPAAVAENNKRLTTSGGDVNGEMTNVNAPPLTDAPVAVSSDPLAHSDFRFAAVPTPKEDFERDRSAAPSGARRRLRVPRSHSHFKEVKSADGRTQWHLEEQAVADASPAPMALAELQSSVGVGSNSADSVFSAGVALSPPAAGPTIGAYSPPDFRSYQPPLQSQAVAASTASSAAQPNALPMPGVEVLPSSMPLPQQLEAMQQQQMPMFLQRQESTPMSQPALQSLHMPLPSLAPSPSLSLPPAQSNNNLATAFSLNNLPPAVTALISRSQQFVPSTTFDAQPHTTNVFILQSPSTAPQDTFSVRSDKSIPPIVLA